jgi:hypothetical protein
MPRNPRLGRTKPGPMIVYLSLLLESLRAIVVAAEPISTAS